MKNQKCPRYEQCRLIRKELSIRSEKRETYIESYCRSAFDSCKRLVVIGKLHFCPDFVLPDSSWSVEEIMDKIENET